MKKKDKVINRVSLVEVFYPKEGEIVWTCVDDNIIGKKGEQRNWNT